MAFPVFRAAGALAHGVGAVTPGAPASSAADDVQLLVCESMDEAISLATAAGFVEVAGSPISVPSGTATIATRGALFWRRWDGVAGLPTTNDPGNHILAQIFGFSGCIATGDPWDFINVISEAVEDTSGSAAGDTTLGADRLLAIIVGAAKPDSLGTAELSAWTNADLANLLERADNAGNSGNGGHVGMATGEKAAAGAVGATTYTKATSAFKWHFVVALKPPASGDFPLDAQPGSYAVTGTVASPLADRVVPADLGAYALDGAAASPLADRVVPADLGAYALSGAAASPLADRVVPADLGAYALSGPVAGLPAGRELDASPGSYVLSGVLAELGGVGVFELNAAAGAYTLVGVDAGLAVRENRHGFSSGFKPRFGDRRRDQEGRW